MGDIVTERLGESFANLMDYNFTAQMEERLDDVAHGNLQWKQLLNEFYQDFHKKLELEITIYIAKIHMDFQNLYMDNKCY